MKPALAILASCAILAACDQPKKPPRERAPAETRVEKVIDLGGGNTVHVLAVPTGFMESTRCVVITSAAGSPAVSCTPKDIDLTRDE